MTPEINETPKQIPLCEKYRASCFADIRGQDHAVERIKIFMQNFPRKRALILHGSPGTGKTSLIYALAAETNAEILELNASDFRDKVSINSIIGNASQQSSLLSDKSKTKFFEGKILLIDEVDGLTTDDRGGLPELIRLMEETKFPILITANNIWDKKFNDLRKKAEVIELKELDYNTILSIVKTVALREGKNLSEDVLKNIAIKSKGDVRAALNDLQSISAETTLEEIHERDKEEKIFNVLKHVFKSIPNYSTIGSYDKLNMSLDEVFLWVEENIPKEYQGSELAKAYDTLSKADVFRGRILRQQHWRFLVYESFLMSFGIAAAKKKNKIGYTAYEKPSRILKIWLINQKTVYKKSIAEKYAEFVHIGKKRAQRDFPLIKMILNKTPEIIKKLELSEDEIEFLKN